MTDSTRTGRDLVHRCQDNPLFDVGDLGFPCGGIYNAGAVRHQGQVLLLVTIETLQGRCCIHVARSDDGRRFAVQGEPLLARAEEGPFAEAEGQGVRDGRITPMDGQYYFTYLAESADGFRPALARTADFREVERVGLLAEPDAKAAALFPRKIGGRHALLYRPSAGGSIWVKYSDDLQYWGEGVVVMSPRGGYWDSSRIGAAAPPMEIEDGWLLLYYGAKQTSAGPLYRLGAAILERDDPSNVLHRLNIPLLGPREMYERVGDLNNTVFSCGALLDEDGTIQLYYGGADSCMCLGTVTVERIIESCLQSRKEY